MDITSCHVPLEILECIFQALPLNSIKAVRQVCKLFSEAASPSLIRSAWISMQPSDWHILKAISEHEVFRKNIRELVYDASCYEICDLARYMLLFQVGSIENCSTARRSECAKDAVIRGHKIYQERWSWQEKTIKRDSHIYISQTQCQAIVDKTKTHEDTHGVEDPVSGIESALIALVRAIKRMPALRKISISCRRFQLRSSRRSLQNRWSFGFDTQGRRRYRVLEYSLECDKDSGSLAAVLHPTPMTFGTPGAASQDVAIWDRGLALLDLAMYACSTQQVKHCNLDVVGGHWNFYDTDTLHLLQREQVYHPCSAMNLTTITLTLFTFGYMSRFTEWDGNGAVRCLLSAALNLRDLSLRINDPSRRRSLVDLENLIGDKVWQNLRRVRLEGLGLCDTQIVDLLLRHQHSLRQIELVFIGLLAASAFRLLSYQQNFNVSLWRMVLVRMADLHLEHLLLTALWDVRHQPNLWQQNNMTSKSWCSSNRNEIRDFLLDVDEGVLSALSVKFEAVYSHS